MLLEFVLILQPDDSQSVHADRKNYNAILLRIVHMDSLVITISINQVNLEGVLTWRIWIKRCVWSIDCEAEKTLREYFVNPVRVRIATWVGFVRVVDGRKFRLQRIPTGWRSREILPHLSCVGRCVCRYVCVIVCVCLSFTDQDVSSINSRLHLHSWCYRG